MDHLKTGDVIRLEEGMRVNAKIPEVCYFSNVDFSDRTTIVPIEIGKIYQSNTVSKKKYIEYLSSKKVSSEIISFIASSDFNGYIRQFDTANYVGEYVVENAYIDGGGTSTYNIGGGCTYQYGWHVFAQKIEFPKVHVSFYQSGDFSTLITNISPLYLKSK